ncbi:MAG: hypothetical protein QOD03_1639 [Verrucomicrobiota bacterium]|jgi:uncharacterized protein YggT (Ycf19 family)
MSLIDFILNIAALLLWLNWRSAGLDPLTPATLTGTLRRIESPRFKRSHFLIALGILLLVRAVFYGVVGPAINWTPKLNLVIVTLAFPSHVFFSVLLFSVLSFVRVALVFYFWLLALSIINRNRAEADPLQKMLLLQLGRVTRWPNWAQLIAPVLIVGALWVVLHPVLVYASVVSRVQSNLHLIEQGLLVGAVIYFSLKFLLPAFLFVYLIATYVYLGKSLLWDFITLTSINLLKPFERLPLAIGKVDLKPILAIILILLLLHALPNFILILVNQNNRTLWPL